MACRSISPLTPGEAHDNRLCSPQRLASTNDAARGSWIRRGLDQGACSPAGSMGEHSAETETAKSPICFSPYLYRAET